MGDDRGEPWFIAADVGAALGHSNQSVAVSRLDDDEKGVSDVYTLGGPQWITTVSEPGVYRLLFTSRVESAERFKRWLAHDVLPSIRKTGAYAAPGATLALPQDYGEALEALLTKLRENKTLAAENADKERQLAKAQPAVAFVAKYVEAGSTRSIRDTARLIGVRESVFIERLIADRVLYRLPAKEDGTKGRLQVYAERLHSGLFDVKTGLKNSGTGDWMQPRFTTAGITWAAERYSEQQPPAHEAQAAG